VGLRTDEPDAVSEGVTGGRRGAGRREGEAVMGRPSACGYRVEHREGGTVRVLAHGVVALAPLAETLVAAGRRGELALIDTATERVVVRSRLTAVAASHSNDGQVERPRAP